ncbi:MAG: hypothetical protein JXA52_04255, partial [Planctomycetes bacterium]|nr:hypothetical protein [Planctomycetota bacterium]
MRFPSKPASNYDSRLETPASAKPPAKQRLNLRRFGCLVALVAFCVITLTWLCSDYLLRAYVENQAASALGMPVSVGELRLFIFGRPSITLKNVEIGKDPVCLHLDHINIAFKKLPGVFGEYSIFNIDGSGLVVTIPEETGVAGGTDFTALMAWLRSPHPDWAIPETSLRGVKVIFSQEGGLEDSIKADAIQLEGIAAATLREIYPEIAFKMHHAGISEGSEEYFKINKFETLVRIDPQGPVIVKKLKLDSSHYSDRITAGQNPGDQGSFRLGKLLRQIAKVSGKTGLASTEADASSVATSLTVEEFKANSLTATITDERGGSVQGKISAEISELTLQQLQLSPSGKTSLSNLILNHPEIKASHSGQACEFAAAAMSLDNLNSASLTKDLPGFNLVFKNPRALSFGAGGITRIAKPDDAEALLKLAIPLQEYGSGIKVNSLQADNLTLDLPVSKGKGLVASSELAAILKSWSEAFGVLPTGAAEPEGDEEQPLAVREIALRNLGFHLTGSQSDPETAFELAGEFKNITASEFSSWQAGQNPVNTIPFTCATFMAEEFSTRINRSGEMLFDIAISNVTARNPFLIESEGMPPSNLVITAPRVSGRAGKEFPLWAAFRLNLNFINRADGGREIKNGSMEQPRVGLTINSAQRFVEADDLRSLCEYLQACFPSSSQEIAGKESTDVSQGGTLKLDNLKLDNLQAIISDQSQPANIQTVTAKISSADLANSEEKLALALQGVELDCYSPGKAGGIFTIGTLTLDGVSNSTGHPISGILHDFSFTSRRPDVPAYLTAEKMELQDISINKIDLLAITRLESNTNYNADQEAWDFMKSLEISKLPLQSILQAADNLFKPIALDVTEEVLMSSPDLPDLEFGLPQREELSRVSAGLLAIKRLEILSAKNIIHYEARDQATTITFISGLLRADGIEVESFR